MIDDRHRFWLVAFGALALAGLLGTAVWLAVSRSDPTDGMEPPPKKKVFRRTLIEDLRVTRHGVIGIDFIKCGACRMEKRKKGVFTMGGLNTLVLENLDIVLPPEDGDGGGESQPSGTRDPAGDARDVVRRLGISDDFLAKRGLPFRFSAVRIAGLSVGRLAGSNRVERIFSARSGESGRDGLALSGCCLVDGDGERNVGGARLVLAGRTLRLAWDGGSIDVR